MHMVDALEGGVVTGEPDAVIHAVRMTLRGAEAICGAGAIVGTAVGRFRDAEEHTCLACFALALDEPPALKVPVPRGRRQ